MLTIEQATDRAFREHFGTGERWWKRGTDLKWYATADHKGPYVGPHDHAPVEVLDQEALYWRDMALASLPGAVVYQCPRCATAMEVDPTAKPSGAGEVRVQDLLPGLKEAIVGIRCVNQPSWQHHEAITACEKAIRDRIRQIELSARPSGGEDQRPDSAAVEQTLYKGQVDGSTPSRATHQQRGSTFFWCERHKKAERKGTDTAECLLTGPYSSKEQAEIWGRPIQQRGDAAKEVAMTKWVQVGWGQIESRKHAITGLVYDIIGSVSDERTEHHIHPVYICQPASAATTLEDIHLSRADGAAAEEEKFGPFRFTVATPGDFEITVSRTGIDSIRSLK